MSNIKEKIKSDKGALNSTEIIMLLGLSVFIVLAIYQYIVQPLIKTTQGIGSEITDMNPR